MKSPRQHVWKWRIALMILVAWIGLDGVEMITHGTSTAASSTKAGDG